METKWATRKAVRVEFVEFTGDNASAICIWLRSQGQEASWMRDSNGPYILIHNEQHGSAKRGDFIIRDPRATGGRKFYYLPRAIFQEVYETDEERTRPPD